LDEIRAIVYSFARILLAGISMGIICYLLSRHRLLPGNGFFDRLINLSVPISSGAVAYVIFCFVFKVREMKEFLAWLAQRIRR